MAGRNPLMSFLFGNDDMLARALAQTSMTPQLLQANAQAPGVQPGNPAAMTSKTAGTVGSTVQAAPSVEATAKAGVGQANVNSQMVADAIKQDAVAGSTGATADQMKPKSPLDELIESLAGVEAPAGPNISASASSVSPRGGSPTYGKSADMLLTQMQQMGNVPAIPSLAALIRGGR